MRRSFIISGIVAGVAGGAIYYLASRNGGALRQRARDSAAWLQGQQQDLSHGLRRIEEQLSQLGEEMRQRLDDLAQQAADAVQPQLDADWALDRDDLQEDLPGLPRG